MDKVFDKLSLYDFFGYIIPGFLGVWALSILFNDVLHISFLLINDQGFINSIIFIGISYFIGVLLHEFSEWLQNNIYKKIWKGMPSEKFLLDDNHKYSANFKKNIKDMINEKYNIILCNDSKINQEVINLLYSELQASGKDYKVQLFNALYGMYRNFIAGSILCVLVFCAKAIVTIVNLGCINALDSIIYAFVFIIAVLILSRRLKRFGERFTDYVIRDSYNNYKLG